MNAFETIIYEKKDGIAYITLNRPQALNAVNIKMRDELYEVLPAIEDDPEVMVGIFKGAGDRGFSAGADITEFGTTSSQAIARQVRWERASYRCDTRFRAGGGGGDVDVLRYQDSLGRCEVRPARGGLRHGSHCRGHPDHA
jgi:enoyl-CoA hydratase/carnithine racemase